MSEARDLGDGETASVKGSGASIYTLKNAGGVYSCTCPAWMHQSIAIERRSCKHLRAFRGEEAETARVGVAGSAPRASASSADAPPLLLAHKWELEMDPRGWWMSEKLDGVRAYWNGSAFVSRLGNRFHAPRWFVEGLPDTPLDGELFGGRKRFQRTVGIVKRQDESELWKELRFVVFDAPAHGGTFEERVAHCEAVVGASGAPYAEPHPHVVCRGQAHLREELARVEALGGEGLMMRKPGSRYEAGRSSTLLKVKTFHDAEAIVVAHVGGAGKHRGRLGALVVEMPNGTRFNVGTGYSDAEREDPPPLGTIITYRYQELSDGGVPRFPTYVGVRDDVEWTGRAPDAIEEPIAGALRRFEKSDGELRTFWEMEVRGSACYVRWGTFDDKTHAYESHEEAFRDAERRVLEKLGAGFVEVRDAAGAEPEEDDAPEVLEPPEIVAPPVEPIPIASGAATSGACRYFELVDGKSSKFWEVTLDGCEVTTRYGRIGASGQSTTKDLGSPERARAERDKLVAEKTKKGYRPA